MVTIPVSTRRQKVKEEIAKDRAERAAREKTKTVGADATGSAVSTQSSSQPSAPQPKKEYDACRLQVRTRTHTHTHTHTHTRTRAITSMSAEKNFLLKHHCNLRIYTFIQQAIQPLAIKIFRTHVRTRTDSPVWWWSADAHVQTHRHASGREPAHSPQPDHSQHSLHPHDKLPQESVLAR